MLMSKDHTSVVYDNLVIEAGTVGSIQLQKGQGTLKRGAVLDSNGKLLGARTPSLVETFVETKDETYDPSKTYFTKSNSTYTVASISEFADGTTYYERVSSTSIPTAAYILCDDTETEDNTTVTGIVYKSGTFVKNSIIVASNYELTDQDINDLRKVGIFVEDAQ